ncbi:hypothetical protein CH276_14210 [Rhodococcus sp. 06-470-2]|nr:hypothetical protein CH276_14210 [Rhodococcus sp. 06-470-2]OZE71745.1 hypothetical protein CH265_01690 [Rhodococcus sp. 05-2221-1B]
MGGAYVMVASLWRDRAGVRHRKGDLLDPPESEVDRLIRAGAIKLASDAAEQAVDDEAERQAAEQAAAAKAEADRQAALQAQGKTPAPRPKAAATEVAWEKYAALRGVATDGLNKDQLIAAVDKLDAK